MQSFGLILKSKEQQQNECLWDAVKDNCYADKPETIDALEDNIREVIGEVQWHTIGNGLKNWTDRVGYCMASRRQMAQLCLWPKIHTKQCAPRRQFCLFTYLPRSFE